MPETISPELINSLVVIFLLCFVSFGLATVLTPLYTFFAYRYRLWKTPTAALAELHADKHRRNIPMMAGLVFTVVIAALTLVCNLDRAQTWLPLAALVGGGVVGLIDDIINVRGLGKLREPLKFTMIALVGLACAWFFYFKLGYDTVHVPFPPFNVNVGWLMVPLFAFVVVATGNAVNITDGLDGLAGGLSAMAFGFFGVIALLQGNIGIAGFCFTVVGALLSYTWFNIYPARFFMSSVGSFALGTSLGVVAMLTNTLFLLPIIGFVFVADAATSLVHVIGEKLLHRNVLRAAPIHHHFEAIGWPETKVTMRFWLLGEVCGVIGLLIALTGGYIA